MIVAPIPAPIEAKISDAPHFIVILTTFFWRRWTCSTLLIVSASSSVLNIEDKKRYISMATWTSHVAVTPRKCPAWPLKRQEARE